MSDPRPEGTLFPEAPPDRSGWPWTGTEQPTDSSRDGRPWPRITVVTPSLNQAEFINEQRSKQLKVVADAPRMRDYYRDLATERQLAIGRLTRRIRTLEKLLGIPSTAPATRPATRPAGGKAPPRPATGPASRPEGGQ